MAKVGDQSHGLAGGLRARRGLGHREHPRGDLRRDERKETYATTGLAHDGALLRRLGVHRGRRRDRLPAASATPRACPWAATCATRPRARRPSFLVAALKDPLAGNLDRIQIVKGWVDAEGKRTRRSTTSSGPATASRAGRQAAAGRQHRRRRRRDLDQHDRRPELIGGLDRPGLRPGQRAFYYARVLEIPTPRWTAYEALRFGVEMPRGSR